MLYWQLLKTLDIHELLAFMLEIIIIVLDTEANTKLLILGLPVFCKFNFIFFEDHSNMLKIKIPFPPHGNILLLLKNIFSSIEYWVFLPTHTQKVDKNVYSTMSFCDFGNKLCLVFFASLLYCLMKS